jgi:UDP-N-acetyl-D-galactosamine dehydrogenase
MGATFKENVTDIRNSKVADVVNELKSFSCTCGRDRSARRCRRGEARVRLRTGQGNEGPYDAIIVA